jgi:hypothetical protein
MDKILEQINILSQIPGYGDLELLEHPRPHP